MRRIHRPAVLWSKPTAPAAAAPAAAVGWNIADATAVNDYTLSNSNKTATRANSNNGGIRGLGSKTSGLLYFESFVDTDINVSALFLGIASAGYALATSPYSGPGGSFAIYYDAGGIQTDTGAGPAPTAYITNDVLGFEVSFAASTVRFFKNNTLQSTASFTSGSAMFPVMQTRGATTGAVATVRTLAADQTYPSRSGGYVSWD